MTKVDTNTVQFYNVEGIDIALRQRIGEKAPGLIWIGGYRSDMLGTKAVFLNELAIKENHSFLSFDYSGHGESKGDFFDGSISLWLAQSLAVFERYSDGPQILIGSSMGGWITLRMVEELKKKGITPAAIILLAPAPDFTKTLVEPTLTDQNRQDLQSQGYFNIETEYGATPYTKKLLDDGANNLVLKGIIDTGCPVHIIQGMKDDVVPYQSTMKLMEHLPLNDVTLTLVHDGDHRLSRPQDLALLERVVKSLI